MKIDELREWAKEKASYIVLAQPEHLTPLKQLEKIENLIGIVIKDVLQSYNAADGDNSCEHEFKPLYCHGEIEYCEKCGATRR